MLIIGNTEFKPPAWGFPPNLVKYRDNVLKLVNAPDAYRFGTENLLIAALQAPDQAVDYQYKINRVGAALNGNASLNAIFAAIEMKKAKDVYKNTQQAAATTGGDVFTAALLNNKAVFAAQKCTYYVQGAYMSGDQFAVGAALTQDPKSLLILLYANGEQGAANRLVTFYAVSCGLTAARLMPVLVPNSKAAYASCLTLIDSRINKTPAPVLGAALNFMTGISAGPYLFPVGGATTDVAACVLETDKQGTMRKQWNLVDPNQNTYWTYRVDKFLTQKGIHKTTGYVILWVRFSGKEGGAHAELDDSWTGLGQVVHALLKEGKNVVLVGRPRKNKSITDKMNQHLKTLDEQKGAVPRDNLKIWGEYWKTESDELNKKIIGATRAAEYAIFLRMMHKDWGCKLVHVGMRSGAMDAAALLGMKTLFVENAGNEQIGRTTKWTGERNNNPIYKRLDVSEMPTWRARKAIHGYTDDDDVMRGYQDDDLTKIVAQVNLALR
jgi:hypothetical protein